MTLIILTLIFALLVAVFAIQNASLVAIRLFWVVTEVPLVLVILGSAVAGALIVFLIAVWREFRLKRKIRIKPAIPVAEKLPDEKTQNEQTPDDKI